VFARDTRTDRRRRASILYLYPLWQPATNFVKEDSVYLDGVKRSVDKLHESVGTGRPSDGSSDGLDEWRHSAVRHGLTVDGGPTPQSRRPSSIVIVVV